MASGDSGGGVRIRAIPILLALVAAAFLVVRGCQQGPFGRKQIVALNPTQEAALGAQAFQKILQESDIVQEDRALNSGERKAAVAVQDIGHRLAEASIAPDFLQATGLLRQEFAWEFRLVRSNQINAFCLPGGKVVVYTGIIPIAKNKEGLATVMGHEIGHALAHHGAERMAQEQLVQLGQQAAAQSIDGLDPQRQAQLMGLLGASSKFGVLLPFSRKHESEADHIGLLLMAAAGYDPNEAPRFWQRMEKSATGGRPSEFTSTHPSHEHRVRDLGNWLPDAIPLYDRSPFKKDQAPTSGQ